MRKIEIVEIVGSGLLFSILLYLGLRFTSQRLDVLISLAGGFTLFVLVYLTCYLGFRKRERKIMNWIYKQSVRLIKEEKKERKKKNK